MRQRLPPGHLDRPKQGFGLPIGRWLAEERKLVADASQMLMDAQILRRRVDHYFDREWLLLVLAKWLELNA